MNLTLHPTGTFAGTIASQRLKTSKAGQPYLALQVTLETGQTAFPNLSFAPAAETFTNGRLRSLGVSGEIAPATFDPERPGFINLAGMPCRVAVSHGEWNGQAVERWELLGGPEEQPRDNRAGPSTPSAREEWAGIIRGIVREEIAAGLQSAGLAPPPPPPPRRDPAPPLKPEEDDLPF